jgi:hypothetical protein
MQTVSNDTFGPLIAYLVPGATVLTGLSPFLPVVQTWLEGTSSVAPTIGGLLYLSLASFGAGMTVSAVRWATVDTLHARTGIRPPKLNFANLPGKCEELRLLIEIHYRHYQFYANMLVAILIAYAGYRIHVGFAAPGLADLALMALAPVFYFTSRDTLRKYYVRSRQLLSPRPRRRPSPMEAAKRSPEASSWPSKDRMVEAGVVLPVPPVDLATERSGVSQGSDEGNPTEPTRTDRK